MRGFYPGERGDREESQTAAAERTGAGRRLDWVVGILLGIVLGICVIVAFLAFGSEGTIDAPSVQGVENGNPPARSRPAEEVRESR